MTGSSVPIRLRFAPSPNGRLHLGHAYSALVNELFAARLGGDLILRIEDIDPVRSRPDLIAAIADDLAWLGIGFGGSVRRQSEHFPAYRRAIDALRSRGLVYPCFCSRAAVIAAAGPEPPRDPDGAPHYPGTCRVLSQDERASHIAAGLPHSWRLDMNRALAQAPGPHRFSCLDADCLETSHVADPARWGDAPIARRDVPTSYHLSVVVDDAAQDISHVVRGADLAASTDLHVLLQALLGLECPAYHHHALILGPDGTKLAKSRGSESLGDLRARGVTPAEIRRRLGFG
ncbi:MULTISPECIES: tRNA glutamyl-Q(34) synthetase GluQRS [Methylobacterium]|uniref:Glutamate--tRNA ligase n=1 Tax=Methylobacterium bullatum TaxID=570505 RepID=A0AAV4ZE89_9HYPH|nr:MULTISPECIES: tRNA glutamyl-Q(34) synthetase GluQRS [Methylobacterium]MBD8901185.1 tRNA glutamyl-Q(34) synthetase GluQRS [Methylobacterium bullatum]TXN25407.1 tRNA glutamyl-Q(34) synthetase GluQRS [Methylobacterium sp. WL19]GJD42147.1 Glutamate--tRNA ligase [Methylobacterium bullatum]